MSQLGADVDALAQLSARFSQGSEELRGIAQQIDGLVNSAWWQGADADNFRAEWGEHLGALNAAAERLNVESQRVKQQEMQQRETSGA